MAALVLDERIYETSTTTGTGSYTLAGAVTGFQPFSVLATGNYCYYFATDDTNWEIGIGTYTSGPDTLARTAVIASSNGDAAVSWGAGTKKIRCGLPAFIAQPRQKSKSVAGAADVTLTADEQRCHQLILTGVLTGNINVIVDTTKWAWSVYNNTTGAFTLTVKTSAGTGVLVTQGKRALLACDGTNVVSVCDDLVSPSIAGTLALTGVISPTQITSNQNDYSPTGLSTASVLRLSPDASRDLTGLAGGASGRIVVIHNVGSNNLVLKDSVTSTAANQFALNGDITLGADQSAVLQYDGTSSRWRAIAVSPAAAASDTAAGVIEIAIQSEMETGTDTTRAVVPGRQQFHPSACKGWLNANGSTAAINASYNVSGTTDTGTGIIWVSWGTDFSSANHVTIGSAEMGGLGGGNYTISTNVLAAGIDVVECYNLAAAKVDPAQYCIAAFGDQV